jgi:hypothetical protein
MSPTVDVGMRLGTEWFAKPTRARKFQGHFGHARRIRGQNAAARHRHTSRVTPATQT